MHVASIFRGIAGGALSLVIVATVHAQYSGGSGTAEDPYQIATAADLITLGQTPDDYDKHFRLVADIDLTEYSFQAALIAPDADPCDLAFQGVSFAGTLDGSSHTVSNLTVSGEHYLGLFGRLEYGAEIKNLRVVDVNVAGSDYVSGFVGFSKGNIATSCCTGTVGGNRFVGGLTGRNWGSINASYSTATVTGSNNVGGLAAGNYGSITNSYSSGATTADWDVGGLAGTNSGTISTSYSAGAVDGANRAGGLVGRNYWEYAVITSSFWDAEASGLSTSDGGTALITYEMQTAGTFLDAGWDFVDETENGTDDVWKIVEGQTYPLLAWQKYGGGTGEPNDPYLIYTAEHLNVLGAEPNDYDKHFKLMADIDLSGHTYERAVIAPDVNDATHSWAGPLFEGTPFTGVFEGNDHAITHLSITGASYLGLFGQLGDTALVSDLGLAAANVNGTGDHAGALAGSNSQGGSIANCYTDGVVGAGESVGGLVGHNRGRVTASYSSCTIGGYSGVAGLAGYNGGSVEASGSTGQVTGNQNVGGLVGWNDFNLTGSYSKSPVAGSQYVGGLVGYSSGNIDASCSLGEVSGTGLNVGGLVGHNMGSISTSYSASMVDGRSRVGGLVGRNGGWRSATVVGCYSVGPVKGDGDAGGLVGKNDSGSIASSFWDVETSGQANSDGGMGKTPAEMQTASTFLEAGWDFIGETENGTDDIWWILEGQDYPRLWWEARE